MVTYWLKLPMGETVPILVKALAITTSRSGDKAPTAQDTPDSDETRYRRRFDGTLDRRMPLEKITQAQAQERVRGMMRYADWAVRALVRDAVNAYRGSFALNIAGRSQFRDHIELSREDLKWLFEFHADPHTGNSQLDWITGLLANRYHVAAPLIPLAAEDARRRLWREIGGAPI